jgi:hypothetical protein
MAWKRSGVRFPLAPRRNAWSDDQAFVVFGRFTVVAPSIPAFSPREFQPSRSTLTRHQAAGWDGAGRRLIVGVRTGLEPKLRSSPLASASACGLTWQRGQRDSDPFVTVGHCWNLWACDHAVTSGGGDGPYEFSAVPSRAKAVAERRSPMVTGRPGVRRWPSVGWRAPGPDSDDVCDAVDQHEDEAASCHRPRCGGSRSTGKSCTWFVTMDSGGVGSEDVTVVRVGQIEVRDAVPEAGDSRGPRRLYARRCARSRRTAWLVRRIPRCKWVLRMSDFSGRLHTCRWNSVVTRSQGC